MDESERELELINRRLHQLARRLELIGLELDLNEVTPAQASAELGDIELRMEEIRQQHAVIRQQQAATRRGLMNHVAS